MLLSTSALSTKLVTKQQFWENTTGRQRLFCRHNNVLFWKRKDTLKNKIQSTLTKSNSHKSNNRLSRRSFQVLFSLYSIVFNPSLLITQSQSYFFSPNRFDFIGKVDCIHKIAIKKAQLFAKSTLSCDMLDAQPATVYQASTDDPSRNSKFGFWLEHRCIYFLTIVLSTILAVRMKFDPTCRQRNLSFMMALLYRHCLLTMLHF